jgi:hypothetical protein
MKTTTRRAIQAYQICQNLMKDPWFSWADVNVRLNLLKKICFVYIFPLWHLVWKQMRTRLYRQTITTFILLNLSLLSYLQLLSSVIIELFTTFILLNLSLLSYLQLLSSVIIELFTTFILLNLSLLSYLQLLSYLICHYWVIYNFYLT